MQENQQQSLTFKAKLGDEIRRFSVPVNSEWKEINVKINTLFAIASNERVTVKYEDDEKELVTIDSTAELQEIKRMYGSQCVRLDLIKVSAPATPVSVASPTVLVSSENLNNSNNNNEFARSWRHSGQKKEWKRHGRRDYHERKEHERKDYHERKEHERKDYNERKEWKRKQCEMSREELSEKLKILEDKGYKCKWRNCKMLRMYNGDVDKVCEAFLEHKNKKCKFGEALQQLDSKGFNDKVINIKLLKRYNGDVDKVADILAKVKKIRRRRLLQVENFKIIGTERW
jgi:hypothetical protein